MKKLLLILNPTSGQKKAARHLADIIAVFNRASYDTRVYVTAGRGDAAEAVRSFGADMDLIVCCGGDGTLNETVTGLIHAGLQIPIGYIPAGSTNDFAGSLRLSSDVVKAAEQITKGSAHAYDVGKWGERYFTYIASFGAFTKASYNTPQNIKNILGHVAYVLEGIQELSLIRNEHIRLVLDDEIVEDDFLFGAICNSTSVGGILTLNPAYVDLADGRFEVLLIRAPQDLQEVSDCVVALTNQTYNCGMITFRSADSLQITSSASMNWSLDGEKAEGCSHITIENLHRRITLIH
ncbi:MAG: YegS/Rv2252/BmrU family lipid kinase [Clostridia bacterium]|nr:YegS/Rv2252/BmrU family lipid kinase [Clostridia bacterium]